MQVMRKILWDKRYSGFVWHLVFVLPFIGLSLLFMQLTKGVTWFLISSALRTVFGLVSSFHITSFMEWRHTPLFDGICENADIAYIVMFVVSLVILLYPHCGKREGSC